MLAISNNPYILYQDAVFRNALVCKNYYKNPTYLETIGPSSSPEKKLSVHMDNIARWLYESIHLRCSLKSNIREY